MDSTNTIIGDSLLLTHTRLDSTKHWKNSIKFQKSSFLSFPTFSPNLYGWNLISRSRDRDEILMRGENHSLSLSLYLGFSGSTLKRNMRIRFVEFVWLTVIPGIDGATTQHCHNETGRCYWLGTGSASWDAARNSCQSEGRDLAVMETEELWNYVNSGIFTWVFGKELSVISRHTWAMADLWGARHASPISVHFF